MKKLFSIVGEAFTTWWKSDPLTAGAAVAYYAIFSLSSFFVLIIVYAQYFVSLAVIQGTITRHIEQLVGHQVAVFISSIITHFVQYQGSPLYFVISTIALIIGALGVFLQLQQSLDQLWAIENQTTGIVSALRKRLLAFLVIIFLGLLIIASSMFGVIWSISGNYIVKIFPELRIFISIINIVQLFVVITVAFAIMYSFVPHARVSKVASIIGGIIASLLFAIGRELISTYITYGASLSAYGAASTIIVILIWIYYSSQIFFFGASLAYVIDRFQKREV